MAGQKMESGATAISVAANIKAFREGQNLTYTDVSRRLDSIGWEGISPLAVRRMEEAKRRVDVDDLMALSMVLGVNPNSLLAPRTENDTEKVELTGRADPVMAQVLWGWLHAKNCLGAFDDLVLFRRKALPRWLVEREERKKQLSDLMELQNNALLDDLARRRVADNGDD